MSERRQLVALIFGCVAFAVVVSAVAVSLMAPAPPAYRLESYTEAIFDPRNLDPRYIRDEVYRLKAEGVDIDALDANGHTALWTAVQFNRLPIVQLLLAAGADPNKTAPGEQQPILTAAFVCNDPEDRNIVAALIQAGADVNVVDRSYADTPLHFAVSSGNLEVVHLLVAAGANVNAVDDRNATCLQAACSRGEVAIADFLLANGADPELRNIRGLRPIDQINACPNPEEIQSVFRKHGKDDQRRPELFKKYAELEK